MKMIVIFKFFVDAKVWDTFTYGIFVNDKLVCEMLSVATFLNGTIRIPNLQFWTQKCQSEKCCKYI